MPLASPLRRFTPQASASRQTTALRPLWALLSLVCACGGGSVPREREAATSTAEPGAPTPNPSTDGAPGAMTPPASEPPASEPPASGNPPPATADPPTDLPDAEAETPVAINGQLSVIGTQLVNEQGATVQLKGPSAMWLNWENTGFAQDRATVQWLRDAWGAQLIRAAMGVDTPTDANDADFLSNPEEARARLAGVVDNALALGMYVIIDWHDHDADLHQAQAVQFFAEMAQTYGAFPNVLYEPFNEPVDQSWNTIRDYHLAVVDAIRASDPDNVIILGTPNYSQFVDEAAGNPLPGAQLMYTLHFYACTHTQGLRDRGNSALAAGLPLFVTEWGATAADGGVPPAGGGSAELCLDQARQWHSWMNDRGISWAAWKLDDCRDLSCYFQPGVTLGQTQAPWGEELLNGHAQFVRSCTLGSCQ